MRGFFSATSRHVGPCSVSAEGNGSAFWLRDDLAAGAPHALCNAQSGAARHPRARLDVENTRGGGMGTGAGSSQLLAGWGDKYTELQAHAKTPSPLIFLKQRINVPGAWGGQFL